MTIPQIRARIVRATRSSDPRLPAEDSERIGAFRDELTRSGRLVRNIGYVTGADGGAVQVVERKGTDEIVRKVTVPLSIGALLYRLVRELRPEHVLELGTGIGGSAAHIVAGLRANGRGSLLTVEGAEERAAIAVQQLALFGTEGWRVVVSLVDEFLPRLEREMPAVDLAFLDADHVSEGIIREVDAVAARMHPGGVILVDDVHWPSAGDGWREVCLRADCAWACEPLQRGRRRLGVWVKGERMAGYRGRPEPIETIPPYALGPVWRAARRLAPLPLRRALARLR